jgi:short-subunit dehydrogenase
MKVVITGAANGLGEFLAKRFFEIENCQVIGVDITKFKDLNTSVKPLFTKYYESDLARLENLPALIEKIIYESSGIDVFINNAGLKVFRSLSDLNIETVEKVFRVNSLAPIVIIKTLLSRIKPPERCTIINISSNAGFKGYKGGSIYCSSKAALNVFTEAVVDEYKGNSKIEIYTICPSTIFSKEISDNFPDVNPQNYIQPEKVFLEIQKLTTKGSGRKIIPIISIKQALKYAIDSFGKNLLWLVRK